MDQRVGLGREALYEIEPTPDGLVDAVLTRINQSSSLWQQQYGRLHDVVVVEKDWARATYYEEMPPACIQDGELGGNNHYYTVSLEFEKGETGSAHPVIRRWSGRRLVSEKHFPKDLSGEWKNPETHIAPLRYFFMEQLLESAEYDLDLPVGVAEEKYARFAV